MKMEIQKEYRRISHKCLSCFLSSKLRPRGRFLVLWILNRVVGDKRGRELKGVNGCRMTFFPVVSMAWTLGIWSLTKKNGLWYHTSAGPQPFSWKRIATADMHCFILLSVLAFFSPLNFGCFLLFLWWDAKGLHGYRHHEVVRLVRVAAKDS